MFLMSMYHALISENYLYDVHWELQHENLLHEVIDNQKTIYILANFDIISS